MHKAAPRQVAAVPAKHCPRCRPRIVVAALLDSDDPNAAGQETFALVQSSVLLSVGSACPFARGEAGVFAGNDHW